MTLKISGRSWAAEKLWRLKIAFEASDHPTPVLFTKLMQDLDYRQEMCLLAYRSVNPVLQALGKELLDNWPSHAGYNAGGESRHAATPGALERLAFNQDIIETMVYGQERQGTAPSALVVRRWPLWMVWLATLFLLVVGLAYYEREWLSTWLSQERPVNGVLQGEQHWTADHVWHLDGLVFVAPGASLHIGPGTVIKGHPGSALIVTRGAQLFARGRASAPIVFTSSSEVGRRQRGDWGGLVLLGDAPVNKSNANIEGLMHENAFGAYGGLGEGNGCGVLEYVRIEFAGFEAFKDNELNGLTLGGCGSATLIRNIQVHRSLDDGIEIFGGSVDLKNVLVTGAGDDSIDWDLGWHGRMQFVIAQHYEDMGDNAIEGDNQSANPQAMPRSEPTLFNVTLITPESSSRYLHAITLKHGTAGHLHNIIAQGFADDTLDLQGKVTIDQVQNNALTIAHFSVFSQKAALSGQWFADEASEDDDQGFDETRYFDAAVQDFVKGAATPLPPEATSEILPRYAPRQLKDQSTSTIPQDEFWDKSAHFRGAVRPGSMRGWWDGWSSFPVN